MESTYRAPEGGFGSPIGRSISLDHAAALLGVTRRTIYNRIRTGQLQTIRTRGGSQRVLLESVPPGVDRRQPAPGSPGTLQAR